MSSPHEDPTIDDRQRAAEHQVPVATKSSHGPPLSVTMTSQRPVPWEAWDTPTTEQHCDPAAATAQQSETSDHSAETVQRLEINIKIVISSTDATVKRTTNANIRLRAD